jgi:hypothetical protein
MESEHSEQIKAMKRSPIREMWMQITREYNVDRIPNIRMIPIRREHTVFEYKVTR